MLRIRPIMPPIRRIRIRHTRNRVMTIRATGTRFMSRLPHAPTVTTPITPMDVPLMGTTDLLGSRMESSSALDPGAGADVIGATGMVDGAATMAAVVTTVAGDIMAVGAIPVDAATVADIPVGMAIAAE